MPGCQGQWSPHQLLTCTRAVYIGRAAPTPSHEGLESVQKPLYELYLKCKKSECQRAITDQDATLFVLTSGILMQAVNPLDDDLWLPIQDLICCVAVKPIQNPHDCRNVVFAPCNSAEACASPYPPVFAAIIKRGKGMKISDCYAFICPSDEVAVLLVEQCMRAFKTPHGWATDRPTRAMLGLEMPKPRADYECYVDDVKDDCPPEFYEKPSLSGYFYAPRSDLVQKFSVKNEDDCDCRPLEPFTDQPQAIAYVPVVCADPCKKKKEKKSRRKDDGPAMSQWVLNGAGEYGPAEETVDVYRQGGGAQTAVWDFGSPTGEVQVYGGDVNAYARQLPAAAPVMQQNVYGRQLMR